MAYIPKHFKLYELVPEKVYNKFKNNPDLGFRLFDPYLLLTMDRIRTYFDKPITVNTWKNAGSSGYSQRGYRELNSSVGASASAHKCGRAFDFTIKGMTAVEFRQELVDFGCFKPGFKDRTDEIGETFKYICRVEFNQNGKPISWIHIDSIESGSVPNKDKWYFGDGALVRFND